MKIEKKTNANFKHEMQEKGRNDFSIYIFKRWKGVQLGCLQKKITNQTPLVARV